MSKPSKMIIETEDETFTCYPNFEEKKLKIECREYSESHLIPSDLQGREPDEVHYVDSIESSDMTVRYVGDYAIVR